jgi:beta-lactamase regulating signal transducer with metallopeptidase domain
MDNVRILVSQDVIVPYFTGVLRPCIYLPNVKIPEAELEMILRHEYQHYKSRDLYVKLFYLMLSIVFWWNPFTHVFRRELDNLLEIRCDEAMTKHMGNKEKVTYLRAMDFIIEYIDQRIPENTPAMTYFIQAERHSSFMIKRIDLIAKGKKSLMSQVVSVVLVVLVFCASFLIIAQPAGQPPESEDYDTFYITPENALLVLTVDGTYRLYIYEQFVGELQSHMVTDNPHFADVQIIDEGS